MPKPRKPYTHKETTRHGKTVWYFRRGKDKRIRLRGQFGSPEFNASYEAALLGQATPPKKPAPKKSLLWLCETYQESGRFLRLRPSSQKRYKSTIQHILSTGAELNYAYLTAADIKAGYTRREVTPGAAHMYLAVMKNLFEFAVDSGFIENNPAKGLKPKKPKVEGYYTWSSEDIATFNQHHQIGTRERLAIDIMLYTGMRVSDAILFGDDHIRNDQITYRSVKTNNEVTIPLLKPLAVSIAAANASGKTFLKTARGRSWDAKSFSDWFSKLSKDLGIKGSAHGLRKAGATLAAENGATTYELKAMFGWTSTSMAEIYTKKTDKIRLAERAASKLSPHPVKMCGNDLNKIQE